VPLERLNGAIPKCDTMHFTFKTSTNGVIERNFILDEIASVLWSPTSGTSAHHCCGTRSLEE
jgi:hypothetical protein